jgi:GNAT superfamily N-acetyltransferase
MGLIADMASRPIGAAWWRFFTEQDHGYGLIEPAVPEVSIGVSKDMRGRGVGRVLLEELIERARDGDPPALSLSVEKDNPALRLYERLGFARVGRDDNAWTMRLDTRQA